MCKHKVVNHGYGWFLTKTTKQNLLQPHLRSHLWELSKVHAHRGGGYLHTPFTLRIRGFATFSFKNVDSSKAMLRSCWPMCFQSMDCQWQGVSNGCCCQLDFCCRCPPRRSSFANVSGGRLFHGGRTIDSSHWCKSLILSNFKSFSNRFRKKRGEC